MKTSACRSAHSNDAYVNNVSAQNKIENTCQNKSILSPTTTTSPAQAKKEHLEYIFGELFSQYNYLSTDILSDLSKITGKQFSDNELLLYDNNKINDLYKLVTKAFDENYDSSTKTLNVEKAIKMANQYHTADGKSKIRTITQILDLEKDSGASNEEKIVNYFKTKLEEYKSKNDGDSSKAKEELIKDFDIILANTTSDTEKKMLFPVLLYVIKDVKTVENFFSRIKDTKVKTDCADSFNKILESQEKEVSKNKLDIDKNLLEIINNNMSYEGLKKYKSITDNKYREFYEQEKILIDEVVRKRQNHIPLDPNTREVEISERIDKFFEQYNVLQAAIIGNKNLSDAQQQELTNDNIETQKKYSTYQLYMESLAQFVADNKIDLNIAEDKLADVLDKATDGKYSEIANALAEKNSAYDSEKGGFKTPVTKEEVVLIQQAIAEQTQQLYIEQEPEEGFTVEPSVTHKTSSANNSDTSSSVLTAENYTPDSIMDIFTGKIDAAEYVKQLALKDYKLLGISDKGDVLMNAASGFFTRLLDATKDSTLKEFLDRGLKAKTFAQTQKIRDKVDEADKNDAA